MANQDPDVTNEREDDQQPQSGNQNKKSTGLLSYTLIPMIDAVVFTLTYQSAKVTDFLKEIGIYQATNGIRITLGCMFPEWKESLNMIYLDGTDGRMLNRPDTTRFPANGRMIRDNKVAMFNAALLELTEVIQKIHEGQPILTNDVTKIQKFTLP